MKLALKILILLGIFLLPIINSRITTLLGFSFGFPVSGNYEFTKVMFFNIWVAGVFSLFSLNVLLKKISLPKFSRVLYIAYLLLVLSTYFSETPYISFFGNNVKAHSFFMWSNLLLLYIVFSSLFTKEYILNSKTYFGDKFLREIVITSLLSVTVVGIIGVKEYFWPMYSYGDLSNRLFSTFGHPNYVSIFFVALFPFIIYFIKSSYTKNSINLILLVGLFGFILFCLLLTKSLFAIFLAILYIVFEILQFFYYKRSQKNIEKTQKIMNTVLSKIVGVTGILLILGGISVFFFLPEKLASFVSRFYIWETVLRLSFSDIKSIFIGHGVETLVFFFDNAKSEYLYIYENIGFTADRPHNLFLNSLFHFGIGGLLLIVYLYWKIFGLFYATFFTTFSLDKAHLFLLPSIISLCLIGCFLLLNFASIAMYLIIVILLSYIIVNTNGVEKQSFYFSVEYFIIPLLILTLFGAFNSYKFYISEIQALNHKLIVAKGIYKYNPVNYYYSKDFVTGDLLTNGNDIAYYYAKLGFEKNIDKKIEICNSFVEKFNYPETYIYCGNHLWDFQQEEKALIYYNKALELLPDLWNKDSPYYSEFGVKHFKVSGNRFLSEKYGLAQVLERVGINIDK